MITAQHQHDEYSTWIEHLITSFVEESPDNCLGGDKQEKAWEDPIVGFSRGDDPLYQGFKGYVGPFHWTPYEIFALAEPDAAAEPAELTVITWVLPQTGNTKADNRRATVYPSERWARARIFGEEFNMKLRKHVVTSLAEAGYKAVAPMLHPSWETKMSNRFGYASRWSERHAVYASGLGTFGLCDGLITPKGKAMRVGSVVARIQLTPTLRSYQNHNQYCLFLTQSICGECIERCPVGAITEKGHDKTKCREYLRFRTAPYVKSQYGFDGYGCGLCQTGVPCESNIPHEADVVTKCD